MTTDHALLAEYATRGSEQAFREVVARYINLVYSTAVRLLRRDTHLAEDVAQTVFADLGRLAGTLSPKVMLGGWLHRRTCHVAMTVMRSEYRRQNRERQAVEMKALEGNHEVGFEQLAPVLDEAINQLGAEDRTAILLRFFEERDLRAVGEALGTSEDAAQKRVTRALERLRGLLGRRGVTASATALAAALGTHAVTAAPAGLALTVSSAALASAASSGGFTLAFLKLMAMTKLQIAVGVAAAAGVGITLVLEHQTLTRLKEENQALEQQLAQSSVQAKAPSASPASNASVKDATSPLKELGRLRSEVDALRQQTNDLARLRAEHRGLRAATDEPGDPAEAEFKEQTEMRVAHLKQWGLSFILFARDNDDRFPETFEQAARIHNSEHLLDFGTNHFEVVYRGTRQGIADPGKTILLRETGIRSSPKGGWVRVYGFADGSVVAHTEPDEAGFAAWEKDRVVVPR